MPFTVFRMNLRIDIAGSLEKIKMRLFLSCGQVVFCFGRVPLYVSLCGGVLFLYMGFFYLAALLGRQAA